MSFCIIVFSIISATLIVTSAHINYDFLFLCFSIFVLLAQMGPVRTPHHDPYLFLEVNLKMTLLTTMTEMIRREST